MDERTRTSDDELGPNLRRTTPEPIVISRPYSRLRIGLGIAIAIALVIAAYEIVHTARAPQSTSSRNAAGGLQSVGAATVALGNIRVIVNALGTVTPLATVTVQTQISGQLTDVGFTEGQLVNKGAFLAQIDARPYEIAKAQAEGQLAHDQGLLAQARADLKRYQGLVAQNSIALQQADDQAFLVQQYEGTVKLDQAQVDTQALNIAYCHIVSPVTGRIGLRLVDPGNYVQTSSSSSIAVVTQLQPITVIFSVPEDDLPDIMPQYNASTALQVTAFDRANVRQLAIGKVSAVDSQIDTTTGTVKIRSQFDNTDGALFPNQFVNAQLLVGTLTNVVTVPTAAIQRGSPNGQQGSYVYVVKSDNSVTVKPIGIGPTDGSMTAVNTGLAAGDQVVIDGADRLREGLHVNVSTLDGKPPGGAGGPAAGSQGRHGGQNPNSQRSQSPRNSSQ
jgi:multidrug efflux system membrane fusion protein